MPIQTENENAAFWNDVIFLLWCVVVYNLVFSQDNRRHGTSVIGFLCGDVVQWLSH